MTMRLILVSMFVFQVVFFSDDVIAKDIVKSISSSKPVVERIQGIRGSGVKGIRGSGVNGIRGSGVK
jgi:hypothetical protein